MSDLVKFNLPVIKFRVKSMPSEMAVVDCTSPLFKEYSASPCIFQERLKMKKQIQDSYLRFRKKKKNNYIKQLCSSSKKHISNIVEKQSSLMVKNKTNSVLNHLQFTLQVQREDNSSHFSQKKVKEQQLTASNASNRRGMILQRQFMTGSCKEAAKNTLFYRNQSLNVSCLENAEERVIQLSGIKCNYNTFNESRKIQSYLPTNRKTKDKGEAIKYRKSSSFKIDPWRADNMSKIRHYFEEEQFQQPS